MQNQLQRRNDLIPNLVESVKGYAAQEKEIFTNIAASREKLAGARTPEDTIEAANEQSSALSRLLVVVENYPQLKSDANFQRLMDELAGTENRISTERMRYNERIQEFNTLRRRFPSNITAKMFGFKEYPYFEAPAAAQQVPKVNFGAASGGPRRRDSVVNFRIISSRFPPDTSTRSTCERTNSACPLVWAHSAWAGIGLCLLGGHALSCAGAASRPHRSARR